MQTMHINGQKNAGVVSTALSGRLLSWKLLNPDPMLDKLLCELWCDLDAAPVSKK